MSGVPDPITLPPDQLELADRLMRVRALMAESDLDYYVAFDPVNVYYLTNFANYVHERPFLLIVPRTGVPTLLVPKLELSHVVERTHCELEYVTYLEFPAPTGSNWYDVYSSLFSKNARIGIEHAMPIGIANRTPGTVIVTDVVTEARIVKTAYEIGRTVHACSVVDLGHETALGLCRPGILEGEIFGAVNTVMRQKIFTDIPDANFIVTKTLGAVWPPTISHDPHRIPKLWQPMERGGPHVSIVSAQVDGYGVELERTFFLGEVPEYARTAFDVMFTARATALDLLKPGQHMGEIDEAVRAVIAAAGYEHGIIHRTGHGLGITGHEAPFLAIGETRLLEAHMLISVEPGIYFEGRGGYRHSDTILITEDGYVILTHAPELLEELVLPL